MAGASTKSIGTAVTLLSRTRQGPDHDEYQYGPSSNNETYYEDEEYHNQEEEAPENEELVHEHPEEPEEIEEHPEQPENVEPEQEPAVTEHQGPQHTPSSTIEPKPTRPTSKSSMYSKPPSYSNPATTSHQPKPTETPKHGKPTHETPTATSKSEDPKHAAPTQSGKPEEHGAPKHHGPVYDFPVSEYDTPYFEFEEDECHVCVEGEPCHVSRHNVVCSFSNAGFADYCIAPVPLAVQVRREEEVLPQWRS